jgi:3-phosphoshikimate 1-carboxyvinyltransferase
MQYLLSKNKKPVRAIITLPSSKSISNRLLMMSALSDWQIQISNLSDSDDTRIMKALLESDLATRDAGHAGTAMRFLTAYFAATTQNVVLTGTERMKNRPIGELVNCLRELGAAIEYLEKEGFPPLRIKGTQLKGGKISIDSGISSQYISALMMIAPGMAGGLEVELKGSTISSSYLRITAGLMRKAGIAVEYQGNIIRIPEGKYQPVRFSTEPDWSAASYWFSVVGLSENAEVLLTGLEKESLQGDVALVQIFEGLGVSAEFISGGLLLRSSPVTRDRCMFDFTENPDIVQTLVPYCVAKNIPFSFTGCRSLLIKETNRVAALKNELAHFGIYLKHSDNGDHLEWDAMEKPDFSVSPTIRTYKDHRMAMGFAPLCMLTKKLYIDDPEVVSKSYPGFWEDLKKAGISIEIAG